MKSLSKVPEFARDSVLLGTRLLLGQVFLASGLSKWNAWFDFDESKLTLFKYEFFCPDPPRENALQLCEAATLSYPPDSFGLWIAETMAYLAGVTEVVLPVLLIAGLLSRPAAMGLLGMALFIQLAVYPSWGHFINPAAWWLLAAGFIIVFGPGRLSADFIIRKFWLKRKKL
ncbi:putative oxidoreductase [Idiomarina aquatica]|uniref:Putative oxidoreductase n=1 Tax=Idiomarina aquatica TaxID=1327752 RepID=A0A4R6PNZ0_9GAMM|nr:DoxX family protein [Idiomarina aquatica]TDP40302.1 putative oxidoreductase [Idiomarina aquatica]